ncbi:hypothetical protein AAMO2058_000344000 [Amorphochlora amoebiformis]
MVDVHALRCRAVALIVFGIMVGRVDGLLGNLTSYVAYTCPEGFDCWHQNSCPALTVECPTGYFCGTASNFNVKPAGDDELLVDDWCPLGISCPSTDVARVCPEGRYCPASSTTGVECDPGALCPEDTFAQSRFVPLLLMIFIGTGVCLASYHGCHMRDSEDISKDMGVDEFPPIAFELREISVTLPTGRVILNPLTASFRGGEMTAIMGPSGSGKSTVMRAMMGLTHFEGDLLVNGVNAREQKHESAIGFVPQDDVMDPSLTPLETLTYAANTRLEGSL